MQRLVVTYDNDEGQEVDLRFNENGSMFVLEDCTPYREGDVLAYMCSRRLRPTAPNQCWLLKEFLPMMRKFKVVEPVMIGGANMDLEETDESEVGEAVLCNIVHEQFNDQGYSPFGDFCRSRLGQQCQYGSRYIDGRLEGYPNLGEGLRFKGDPSDYHFVRIHRDDMDEFERRYKEYLQVNS